MRAVADTASSMVEEFAEANAVLVLTPPLGEGDGAACSSLLSGTPGDETNVLSVTFNQSPDTRMEQWRNTGGPVDPANLGFVVVGDGVRSAAVATPGVGREPEELGPTVVSVSSPADLTGIGIKLGNFFEDWAGDSNDLRLCFHTLTTLLQYADLRSVYQFVHVLTGRVRTVGGLAHFHLDPAAHDERTVNTLLGLFDGVVEPDAHGSWEVKRRRPA